MSSGDAIAKGLATFLSGHWGEAVEIDNLQAATTGARRRNVLFDAKRGGQTLPLVATIIPNAAIQVMDIEVEADALRLAEAAGMPVPHVYAATDDASFVGGPFFVSTRVEGETIPRRVLRLVESTDGLGPRLGRQCGDALARLHAADVATARPELARPGGSPAEQAMAVVEPLMRALLQPSPAFELGCRWLAHNRPDAPPRNSVCHGDFRNGNIVVGSDGLRATLDWEVCHVGDPMEDLGWLCVRMWRFRSDALEVGGFATRKDLREGYQAAGGTWSEPSFHWWKVYGTLRWGVGLAGQAAAHIDGSVPSIVMAASGRRVAELEYDTLMLLRPAFEQTG